MTDKKLDVIIKRLSEIKIESKKTAQALQIIDKRLLIIEQRLTNIERKIKGS